MPTAGHARCAEVVGGVIFVAFSEFTGFHPNAPGKIVNGVANRSIISSVVVTTLMLCCMYLYVLALVRLPSLHGCYACTVYWAKGALGEIAGKICVRFSPVRVFLFSRNSLERCWVQVLWHLWIGRARKPGLGPQHVVVDVFNVGVLAYAWGLSCCSGASTAPCKGVK